MWKWAVGVGTVAFIGFALWLGFTRYGAAEFGRGRAALAADVNAATAAAEATAREEFQRGIQQGQEASLGFIQWREGPMRTIRETINHEIIRYRDSDAGRVMCFDADGLRAANQSLAAINHSAFAADASGIAVALPVIGADPASGGRHSQSGGGSRGDGTNGVVPVRMRDEAPIGGQSMAEISP